MKRHPRYTETKEEHEESVIHVHVGTPSEPSSKGGNLFGASSSSSSGTKNYHPTSFWNVIWDMTLLTRCHDHKKYDDNPGRNVILKNFLMSRKFLIPFGLVASVIATFLLLSFHPCLYLCSWTTIPKPPGPPERTFEERVEFVETQVRKNRKYLPVTTDNNNNNNNNKYWVSGSQGGYDIMDCPMEPLDFYPIEFPIMDVLNHWPIADTELHDPEERTIHQGFCVFDFAKHPNEQDKVRQQVKNYQKAEKPFVVRNQPETLKTVERWNTNNYLDYLLQQKVYRGEFSKSLSMMYWRTGGNHVIPKDFVPPTKMRPTTFARWKDKALSMEDPEQAALRQDENQYFRFDGCYDSHKKCDALHRSKFPISSIGLYALTKIDNGNFLCNELPWLCPRYYNRGIDGLKDFLIEPEKNRGIQCRFGARGLTAEDHFDNERNFIAVLGGERRYILGHPQNCHDMSLYPMAHPLERHSKVNWNQPNLTEFPNFEKVHVNEVVLQGGDVLYLPTYWFHHIVSLNMNYQCNARSGHSLEYDQDIFDCGFLYPWPN